MEKEYIRINRETYNALAKEYHERNYTVKDEFYLNILFDNLNFQKGQRILEIGPGRGDRLKNFCDYNLDVTAIELSEEMSKLCQQRAPQAQIINQNVFECEFAYQFDYIYMEAMIHNFPLEDSEKLLQLIHQWLKDDGLLICTTTIEKEDSEGYEEKTDYQNKMKRFRHRYTEDSFDKLFETQNFEIVDKKHKKEEDKIRSKHWQIIYAKKVLGE